MRRPEKPDSDMEKVADAPRLTVALAGSVAAEASIRPIGASKGAAGV